MPRPPPGRVSAPAAATCAGQQWAAVGSSGQVRRSGGGTVGSQLRQGKGWASARAVSLLGIKLAWPGSRSPLPPALLLLEWRQQRPHCPTCRPLPLPQTRPNRCQPAGRWQCFNAGVHVTPIIMKDIRRPGTWLPASPGLSHSGLIDEGEERRWRRQRWRRRRRQRSGHTATPHPAALFSAASWMS